MKSVLNIHWKDWCWSWSSDTLATWWEELTHSKRPWCWERLKAGGEGEDRGWDGWMASPTRWTWVWASSGSWWWTGKPGVVQSMGSQKVGHDWVAKLNWNIHRSITHNNPKAETTQMSISWWMDEWNVVYPYLKRYSAIKRNGIQKCPTTQINLENVMVSERGQSQKTTWSLLHRAKEVRKRNTHTVY